jgi:(p)ppGpp synthase/HD superfamily hydrolase
MTIKTFSVGDTVRQFNPPHGFTKPYSDYVITGDEPKTLWQIIPDMFELVSHADGSPLTLLQKARLFARTRHEGQFRRGKECSHFPAVDMNGNSFKDNCEEPKPYFTHPEKVAELIRADGGSEFEQSVAMCHDLIEDGRATLKEIEESVGSDVAYTVDNLTKLKDETYEDFIKQILAAFEFREQSIKIKIADIVANLSDSPTPKQIEKYYKALKILSGV